MAPADSVETFNTPSPLARNVAGLVFLALLTAGAVSVVWYVATGRLNQTAANWTRAQFVQGELTVSLADELAQAPTPVALANAERAVSWLLVGSLGPRVRQGCGPWLFLVDELVVHPDAERSAQLRLAAVQRVRDSLQNLGIELVIATVPDKSRVQGAQLCKVYRPASFQDRLRNWEDDLAKRGITFAPLLRALEDLEVPASDAPFLKSDTHWAEAGAQAAAGMIATTIGQLGIKLTPHQKYVLMRGKEQNREGDLVRLAGVEWLPASLRPIPDKVFPTRFERAAPAVQDAAPSDDDVDASADLFGDVNLPSVALIGSSYSRTSSFAAFLEAGLETPVPNFAKDGGDFWRAAKAYLASAELRDTPPEVVVWEIPERVLQMPISKEEQVWMRDLETARVN